MGEVEAFVRARIGEDQAAAWAATGGPWLWDGEGDVEHVVRWDPVRVLAECDAKLQLLARHPTLDEAAPGAARSLLHRPPAYCACQRATGWVREPCDTKRLLAWPYARHPDWRPEWAPARLDGSTTQLAAPAQRKVDR